MGLASRVAPPGTGLAAAQALARDLARFPQTCLRHDRLSAYEQWDLAWEEALRNEFRHGMQSLPEAAAGAARFAAGEGRHGSLAPTPN
jgi:enoyl-CoA hydratase